MSHSTMLKLGQVFGALLMAAGVAACQMGQIENTPHLMLFGAVIYGGCRLTTWFKKK